MQDKSGTKGFFFRKRGFSKSYDSRYLVSDYQKLCIGFSLDPARRQMGSSGGVGTEISGFLLENRIVETVIGVGFSQDRPYLPEYQAVQNVEDIRKISGSKYVYMEFDSLKKLIDLEKEKETAVFLQPCFVRAVRQMQKNGYTNIKYIISFFCGYNITEDATEYLIKKAGVRKENIDEMAYRWGEYPGGFMVRTKDGRVVRFGKECYELVDLMFLRKGCKKCSLYMGEGADIVLGDAWINSLKNASVVMARTGAGAALIEKMERENKVKLFGIKERELVRMHWHNLKYKKYGMGFFLNLIHQIVKRKAIRSLIPFRLSMFLSKQRRKWVIGIDVDLGEEPLAAADRK
ncbi:MAG: Coenzyme F420 hydrogenase/dehydrogenase, beta subunit C-terminal domain [Candidatus Aminicenantes bacterium]|nr:Coenzyme F420 hydrogenase/dehydrogenase, beta subunit C-terminal domain [Candidatus Aminicenantes bacterium]